MTAKEANERAYCSLIKRAADNGNYQLAVSNLKSEDMHRLIQLGYEVKPYGADSIIISWDNV